VKLKVCGMRERENLKELTKKVNPDYVGFIFHPNSPRYFLDGTEEISDAIAPEKCVGVFVDSPFAEVTGLAEMFQIKNIQLHGNESPEFCRKLMKEGYIVIKAFGIMEATDLKQTENYSGSCNYFLLDTKTEKHGGSGKKFDWKILYQFEPELPFFLSGGIDLTDVNDIKSLKNLPYAIDINSRFEISAGLKDVEKISLFKNRLFNHA